MSCYAFIIRWLLPSQLEECLCSPIFFSLNLKLKALFISLGCFPLDKEPSRSMSDSTKQMSRLRSFLKLSKIKNPPHHKSALPPDISLICRLYFNIFRRKPAIPEFDQPFTPNHKSSQSIATDTGSVLKTSLYDAHINLLMVRSLSFGS